MGKNGLNVYEPDRHGLGDMLRDPELLGPSLGAIAERIADRARETAPYDAKSTSHFRDHFHADVEIDNVLSRYGPHKAVVGVAWNDDPAALSIEAGTAHTPAHHTLTDAMFDVAMED